MIVEHWANVTPLSVQQRPVANGSFLQLQLTHNCLLVTRKVGNELPGVWLPTRGGSEESPQRPKAV